MGKISVSTGSAGQLRMMALAKKQYGRRLDQLSVKEMRTVAAKAAGVKGVIAGAANLATATVTVKAGRTVSLEVLEERRATCRACEFFVVTTDGEPACTDCKCSGHKRIATKLLSRTRRCRRWPR